MSFQKAIDQEPAIDPALGRVETNRLNFAIKFTSQNNMTKAWLIDALQTFLCDQLGASCHFRLAPLDLADFNSHYIWSASQSPQYPLDERNIIMAFVVECTDDDVPLSTELAIIAKELRETCITYQIDFEQMDVRTLYPASETTNAA